MLSSIGFGTLDESRTTLSLEGDNVLESSICIHTSSGLWVNPLAWSLERWMCMPGFKPNRGNICLLHIENSTSVMLRYCHHKKIGKLVLKRKDRWCKNWDLWQIVAENMRQVQNLHAANLFFCFYCFMYLKNLKKKPKLNWFFLKRLHFFIIFTQYFLFMTFFSRPIK